MHPKSRAPSRCPFQGVKTRRRLAELLFLTPGELKQLAAGGSANYKQYQRSMGVGKSPRWIETPKPPLKQVQRRIHDLLIRVEAPPFLFSGVPRRSAVNNAEQHQVNVPVVKLDVRNFFPSSDGRRVYRFFLETRGCSPDVAGLLCDLTTLASAAAPDRCHLPTGGVTSQILAYYAYRDMFSELADLAERTQTVFSVMVDDLTFSGPGATEALLNEARLILRRHGLESKRRKEKAWRSGEIKSVTGVVLTGRGYRLPQSRRIRIHQLHGAVERSQSLVEKAANIQRLAGALFSAGQIEARFEEQGRALMQRTRAEKPLWGEFCRLSSIPKEAIPSDTRRSSLTAKPKPGWRPGDIVSHLSAFSEAELRALVSAGRAPAQPVRQ